MEKEEKNIGTKIGILFIILLFVVVTLLLIYFIFDVFKQNTVNQGKEILQPDTETTDKDSVYISINGHFLGQYLNGEWKSVQSYFESENVLDPIAVEKQIISKSKFSLKEVTNPECYYLHSYQRKTMPVNEYLLDREDWLNENVPEFVSLDQSQIQIMTDKNINVFPFEISDLDQINHKKLLSELKNTYQIPNANLEITEAYRVTYTNGENEKFYLIMSFEEMEYNESEENQSTYPIAMFLVRATTKGNEVIYRYVITEEQIHTYQEQLEDDIDRQEQIEMLKFCGIDGFTVCDLNEDTNPEICLQVTTGFLEHIYIYSLEQGTYQLKLYQSN